MKLRALVPVKAFDRAKSRLAEVLGEDEREALAEALARHVLETLRASEYVEEVVVVTPSPRVRAFAASLDVRAIDDAPEARGLAEIVDAARHTLGGSAHLVVMSDLPDLCVDDIAAIVRARAHADVIIGPDVRGLGTNALALPSTMASCFGHEDSAARHEARALALGLRALRVSCAGIARDVDLPEHLGGIPR